MSPRPSLLPHSPLSVFCSCNMTWPCCFLCIHPAWGSLSLLTLLVDVFSQIWEKVIISLAIPIFSVFSFWDFRLLGTVLQVLETVVLQSFSLYVSVWIIFVFKFTCLFFHSVSSALHHPDNFYFRYCIFVIFHILWFLYFFWNSFILYLLQYFCNFFFIYYSYFKFLVC